MLAQYLRNLEIPTETAATTATSAAQEKMAEQFGDLGLASGNTGEAEKRLINNNNGVADAIATARNAMPSLPE